MHNCCVCGKCDKKTGKDFANSEKYSDILCNYSFIKNKPREVVLDPKIIEKQCDLIEQIHFKGAEVLLSNHLLIPMKTDELVDFCLFIEERKPDMIKIVTQCETDEDMLECFKAMATIKKEIKGLGYSPEYIFETSPSSLIPDFSQMGFAYLSHKAYPGDIEYGTLLVKYDMSDTEFKDKLDDSIDYLSFTKKEDQLSVSKFSDEMAQHKMIGDVFPIVFILVTFLTLLTTRNRIVTHQRTQIGILKAVG